MSNVTVNISFQDSLLRDIDRVAQAETRSRSELLREAARAYIQRRARWAALLATGDSIARERKLTSGDIAREIAAYRRRKRPRA